MGTDIHIVAQKREGGAWVDVEGAFSEGPAPFSWRSYGMFAFLAGVRNYSAITPIAEPRGFPPGVNDGSEPWCDLYDLSWLSVEELSAFDYDQPMEDRRVAREISPRLISGAETAPPGGGKMTTYRDFLGEAFFDDLAELRRIAAERVVFGFD